jgi:hypothetical protein
VPVISGQCSGNIFQGRVSNEEGPINFLTRSKNKKHKFSSEPGDVVYLAIRMFLGGFYLNLLFVSTLKFVRRNGVRSG